MVLYFPMVRRIAATGPAAIGTLRNPFLRKIPCVETYAILTGRTGVGLNDFDHLNLSLLYYVSPISNGDTGPIRALRIF